MKKKFRKFRMIFDIENSLWKSKIGTFDHLSPDRDTKFGNFIWLQWIFGQKPWFWGPIQLARQKVNIHYCMVISNLVPHVRTAKNVNLIFIFHYRIYSTISSSIFPKKWVNSRHLSDWDCGKNSKRSILMIHGILLPKLFWSTVRKNCSSDREKLWNWRL